MTSRTDEWLNNAARLLATLGSNAERRAVLREKIEELNQTYERWMAHVDKGGDPGTMTAFDFVERIAGLESLLAQYERAA